LPFKCNLQRYSAVLTVVYVAGYIQPQAAAVARRVAAVVVSRVAGTAARITAGPRAAAVRAAARLRRSALVRAAALALARIAAAFVAVSRPVAAVCAPLLRRLRPWIAAVHMVGAQVESRLPIALESSWFGDSTLEPIR
jgi:hypothetical protein